MQFRRYRRVGTHHEVPDLVPLFAFGLTPCCPEGLGGNLEVDLGGPREGSDTTRDVGRRRLVAHAQRPSDLAMITFITSLVPA
jgi:hypothetical protein